jgi:hypothetical protein
VTWHIAYLNLQFTASICVEDCGEEVNQVLWGFCGNQCCFVVLCRDKRNGRHAELEFLAKNASIKTVSWLPMCVECPTGALCNQGVGGSNPSAGMP